MKKPISIKNHLPGKAGGYVTNIMGHPVGIGISFVAVAGFVAYLVYRKAQSTEVQPLNRRFPVNL